MICDICKGEMTEREATINNSYRYSLSGLKNVYLAGIIVRKCQKCGIESPIIPRMVELHDVIGQILINKPGLLNGDEIRFLRKNAGFSAKEFSELVGVNNSHLSRIENGKTASLGASADKLVRAIAEMDSGSVVKNNKRARDILLQKVSKKSQKKKPSRKSWTT